MVHLLYSEEFNIHLKQSSFTDWCAMFFAMSLMGHEKKKHIENPIMPEVNLTPL